MQAIWSFINDISFLMVMNMISLRIPGLSKNIQIAIMQLVYLDVLSTDQWLY